MTHSTRRSHLPRPMLISSVLPVASAYSSPAPSSLSVKRAPCSWVGTDMAALPAAVLGMEAFLALLLLPVVVNSGNGPVALRTTLAALLFVGLVVAAALARRRPRAATVLG